MRRGGELNVVVHLLSGIKDLPMKVPFVLRAQGVGFGVNVNLDGTIHPSSVLFFLPAPL